MASVPSLASTLQQQLADALTAALPDAGTADPLLRRSDRADFQANGILALAKKLKGNPRELASQVTAALPAGDLIKDIEVSGPGFLNVTLTDRAIITTLAARAADGERAAVHAVTTGAAAAGRVLGGLANALGPDRVVVGGGVPRIGALYGDALAAAFAAELMPPLRGLVPEPPLFGHDAAVLGAAALTSTLPLHHPGVPR